HVYHADVVRDAIVIYPVETLQQRGRGAGSVRTQNAHVDQLGVGRDARILDQFALALASAGQTADVRAVPVRVFIGVPLAGEINAFYDAVGAGLVHVRVVFLEHPGIHDR